MSVSLGLDDSAYRQSIDEVKAQTKTAVASMTKDYNRLYSEVLHLTAAYQKSSRETGESSKATKELKEKLKEAKSQLDATAGSLRTAGQYMESFGGSAKTSGESLTGAMTKANLLTGILSRLGSAAVDTAKNFIQSGIDYNAQIEKYTTGFTNMLGSAEAAQQVMENIQQDAARTPFDVDSLVSANQYLISAGENATYARKTIMALGDAVAATGGGSDELNRMAQNLQQIANTGKATAVDIKQFAYAGINVYGILADYTGKTTAEVQNMTVSYDLLTKALQAASEEGGRYYNSMDTQSQTMNGRVSTLQDNVKQLAGLLTGDLSSGIGVVIGNLNNLVVAAQEGYKKDGWIGLAGAITGLSGPIDTVKQKFNDLGNAAVTALDKASYWLNKALGKDAYADYGSYEDYKSDKTSQQNRDRRRQAALNGAGISTKSWTERQKELAGATGDGGSSINTNPSGSTTPKKSTKSKTETVIESTSSTATTSALNALGAVTKSIQTLQEKVKDSEGKIKNRVTETATETGKEMVNGIATTYKTVTTTVDGIVTKTQKVYDDMSKALADTLNETTTTTLDGVTTTTKKTTETYADGSRHIKEIITETGKEMVNGVNTTYNKVITKVDGFVTDTQKSYEDMSQTLVSTNDSTVESLIGGVSRATQTVTQKYADNSEHIQQIVTETGKRIVNGAWETYTKVKTILDGQETDSKETTQAVVSQYDTLLSAYTKAQKDVAELQALYNETAASTGEFSEETQRASALLSEAETELSSAKTAWNEYQKTTNRAYVVTKNFADFIKKSNSAFSDFGSSLSDLGEFFDSDLIQDAGDFFTTITDGVDKVINFATSTATLVTTLQELKTTLEAVNATGGISATVTGIGNLLKAGGAAVAGGAAAGGTAAATGAATTGAAATGAAGTAGASGLAALGLSIPELGLIIAGVLGVAAVGYGIYKWATKDRDKTVKSSTPTYKDLQDAYWYGNERAFAGYDYRTDPYTFNPNNSAVLGYQSRMQEQMEKLTQVVQQYLPDVANQQIVLEDGTLVGAMAPGMDAQLGQLAVLAERGN